MNQSDFLSYFTYENWVNLRDNYLDTPPVGVALVLAVFLIALYRNFKEQPNSIPKKDHLLSVIQEFSTKQRLVESFRHKKEEQNMLDTKTQILQQTIANSKSQKFKSKQSRIKQKVKEKYFKSTKRSLLYETIDQRKAQENRKKMETDELKAQQKRRLAAELRAKEQKKVRFQQQKRQSTELKQQPQSKSVRSGERKTTIQKLVEQNSQNRIDEDMKSSQTHSLFNTQTQKIGSLFNTSQTAPVIKDPATQTQQGPSSVNFMSNTNQLGSLNPSTFVRSPNTNNEATAFKTDINISLTQPSLFQNMTSSLPNKVVQKDQPKQDEKKKVPEPHQNIPTQPQGLFNIGGNSIPPAVQPVNPPAAPAIKRHLDLNTEDYFESLIKFAQSQTITVQISTIMANLGGAKSSLNDLLTFAQSFIDTIAKADDSQLTTFSVKIYEGIVRQISTSNLKDGIYRIPPKSKTDQVEKNSINCYILYINLYRLMGYEKVWIIVFGKLLKLLEFTYKRKEDLKRYTELDLLANKHLEKRGEIQGKYLSRIDYLTYLLFGVTAYDPIMIFRQIEEKEPNVRESRQRIESWGRQWSYKQFWMLTDLILKNKHDSYFKPIIYMNILSALYPRIYANKQNPEKFKAENEVYKTVLEEGKKYFSKFKAIKELKILQESEEGNSFQYDGDNFVQGIKVLENRLTVQKIKEFNLKLGDNYANAREFQSKSNVFYYFCKEK